MGDIPRGNRPLSPFMIGPYYRLQITSISSIMVRITGIALMGAVCLVVAWLLAAASSETAFGVVDGLLRSFVGDIVMFLATWALWYHALGRLRHVVWDFGYCLNIETAQKLGWGMFAGATVLAVLTAIVF
ncbi:succinate dehydrogenase, cytochrome b556 subunit [Marivivens niveibacter]|uniref:Succinate dehydrogenase cytochrome b556 subunit n=1 Tax=Marivivens niveibacter TaxID=1930667 RepID=A0A251WXX8_9RHOB|nr:succinate dehydrogenase, cytochrome b556 subunit [Marivivens niveibacter]OUD08968.1 succinate dehydrogenase, cytochrome b556 subunit [Marivivens niveibacter]